MKEIKNIVFDFGGVLLDWNPRHLYRSFFATKEEMEYFLANVCTTEWNAEQDRGRSFSEGVNILQSKFPEYKEAIHLFSEQWEHMLKGEILEGTQLLYEMKKRKYNIFGLTNWSKETIQIAYRKYPFFDVFDGIVVSGEEGLIKPDKRIYAVLLERYKLDAGQSVFIDDSAANIQAARELGFHAVLFDDIANVRKQLAELLPAAAC